ncbi:MAG: cytosolic protein [Desulfobacterales bacterium]|nr:cytosolic protein [Desulfobacterales bacterium]
MKKTAKKKKTTTQRHDYDSPWKDILGTYFEPFMKFFFPEIADQTDWTKGYILLEKELRQITREAETGRRFADKLVRVWKKDGKEAWVLVHAEVQAQKETDFSHRTFVYYYRIHDLFNQQVVSLAILADENKEWKPSEYSQELWGCSVEFHFPTVKILDYKKQWKMLEESDNPFAVVVMAHLKTMETKKDKNSRWKWKLELTKNLYKHGFSKTDIINLYRFIDWIMVLPKRLEKTYHNEIMKFEKENKMQYITTAERIGVEKGIEKGTLIGEILLAQRILKKTGYSPKELKMKSLDELKNIFGVLEVKLTEH